MSVLAGTLNLVVQQGSDFREHLEFFDAYNVALDLTGYSGRMQIRHGFDGALVSDLSTSNGGVVVDGSNGWVDIVIANTATAAFPTDAALRYDLELVSSSNEVTRFLQGVVTVTPEVTR